MIPRFHRAVRTPIGKSRECFPKTAWIRRCSAWRAVHIIGEDDYQHVAKLIEAAAERVTIPTDKQSPFA
jgi:hypothetical protein